MKILGIETSCDETAIAVYDTDLGLLSSCVHSQIALHAQFGGVVPELASRDHIRKITPLLNQALTQAHCQKTDLDAIAYTAGPGLVGALLVGAAFAKALGFALDIPVIPVHHMEAHLLAPFLEANPPNFPFVALLVSGGHTQLMAVEGIGKYQLLGQSLDDAAGEAFDKTAKLLGLGYPGGPVLSKLATQGQPGKFVFPRPMIDRDNLDFSFSGLKTAVLQAWQQSSQTPQDKADIAHAFQAAVCDTLVFKCKKALQQTGYKTLVMAGGVSANQCLREQLQQFADQDQIQLCYPRPEFCTDNAAMVALTGSYYLSPQTTSTLAIWVTPRWDLASKGTHHG